MSASVELQALIYSTLIADAGVSALVGEKVFDGRPDETQYPCITFGPMDMSPDDMEGISGREETIQIDIWSRDGGRLRPCKEIADAVKSALHLADLSLATNCLVKVEVESMRVFLDRDGLTAHGVISVMADIEEA